MALFKIPKAQRIYLLFKVSSVSVKLWNKLENRILSHCSFQKLRMAASCPVAVACLPYIFNLVRGLCVSCLDGGAPLIKQ